LTAGTYMVMQEKAQTEAARDELQCTLSQLERTLYYQSIALAEREWSANNLARVEQLLGACPSDLRGWEWHYLKRRRLQSVGPFDHASAVFNAVFSPDGRWIASVSQDGKDRVW